MDTYRAGLIVPSSNTTMEVDFHRTLPEEVETATARMYLEDTTREGEIRMIEDSLPEAARALRTMKPDVAVFGCTSGGALFGRDYDRRIQESIEATTGTEAITILSALGEEFGLLGARRLVVLTPYTPDLTEAVGASLQEDGLEVLFIRGMGIVENTRIGGLSGAEILAFARETIPSSLLARADCLFISCTNLPAVRALHLLRSAYPGLPIMTSNLAAIQAVRRRHEAARARASVNSPAPGAPAGKS
ncbi:MAG: aspartate/glutamate racemase family protein [Candidatus Tectomicrobia bacterium]|uniref:Aspartate/glutamate racemase family protein n=1 Tax=Tectimicrobiota bacterium TaxID=2528274 RepID=A0A932MMD4_UNCTE|nr:aspartate/glutamate racemase family protein [Candidatus Tectomicrobia bacterium]